MIKTYAMSLLILIVLAITPTNADSLEAMTIIKKSHEALDMALFGTRRLEVTKKDGDQITGQWVARYANKTFSGVKRELLVFLEPEDVKGNAHLLYWTKNNTLVEWVYNNFTRRTRKLSIKRQFDSTMGSDFTYADIGFKDPHGTNRFLGEEVLAGKKAYKMETVPDEKCYYSRIVSWISTDTFLPIQRDYYDVGGRLWKTKLIENVVIINSRPIPLKIQMIDVQRNHRTEISMNNISYNVKDIPDEIFDSEQLPYLETLPVCKKRRPQKNNLD